MNHTDRAYAARANLDMAMDPTTKHSDNERMYLLGVAQVQIMQAVYEKLCEGES